MFENSKKKSLELEKFAQGGVPQQINHADEYESQGGLVAQEKSLGESFLFFEMKYTEELEEGVVGSLLSHMTESCGQSISFSIDVPLSESLEHSDSLDDLLGSPRFSVGSPTLRVFSGGFTRKKDVAEGQAKPVLPVDYADGSEINLSEEDLEYKGPCSNVGELRDRLGAILVKSEIAIKEKYANVKKSIIDLQDEMDELENSGADALKIVLSTQEEIRCLQQRLKSLGNPTSAEDRNQRTNWIKNIRNLDLAIKSSPVLSKVKKQIYKANKLPKMLESKDKLLEKIKLHGWAEELFNKRGGGVFQVPTFDTVSLFKFMEEINCFSREDQEKLISLNNAGIIEFMYVFLPANSGADDMNLVQTRVRHESVRQSHPTLIGGVEPEVRTAGTFDLRIVKENGLVVVSDIRFDSGHHRPIGYPSYEVLARYLNKHIPKQFLANDLVIKKFKKTPRGLSVFGESGLFSHQVRRKENDKVDNNAEKFSLSRSMKNHGQ